jgi:RNA polymerase sigma-70 factor (ECF subfamily)
MEVNDSALVARIQSGEGHLFRELVCRHSVQIFRVAYRITGNEQDAEDAVQETFLKAHRMLGSFEGRSNFTTWLTRIAANCALDQLRSRRQHDAALAPALDGAGEASDRGDDDPENRIFHAQLGRIVQRTLEEMTEQEHAAFVLRHHEQMNTTEIGQLLAISGPAIRQSIFRAVHKLRVALLPFLEREGSLR